MIYSRAIPPGLRQMLRIPGSAPSACARSIRTLQHHDAGRTEAARRRLARIAGAARLRRQEPGEHPEGSGLPHRASGSLPASPWPRSQAEDRRCAARAATDRAAERRRQYSSPQGDRQGCGHRGQRGARRGPRASDGARWWSCRRWPRHRQGETKTSVVLRAGMALDLRLVTRRRISLRAAPFHRLQGSQRRPAHPRARAAASRSTSMASFAARNASLQGRGRLLRGAWHGVCRARDARGSRRDRGRARAASCPRW